MKSDEDLQGLTPIQKVIFGCRLLLVPLYLGLMVAGAVYAIKFLQQDWYLVTHFWKMTEEEVMLAVLGLLDIVMIANLVKMIIIGSYSIFVSEMKFKHAEARPSWISHMTPGALKVKMGSSLVGVSSIHLLQAFINSEAHDWSDLGKKMTLHALFVLSTMALAWIDSIGNHGHGAADHHEDHKEHLVAEADHS